MNTEILVDEGALIALRNDLSRHRSELNSQIVAAVRERYEDLVLAATAVDRVGKQIPSAKAPLQSLAESAKVSRVTKLNNGVFFKWKNGKEKVNIRNILFSVQEKPFR
jgi:hypothetical protein